MSLTGTENPMTQAEYLRSPNICPFCRSTDIVGGSITVQGATAYQPVSCSDCQKEWVDNYRLINYEEI